MIAFGFLYVCILGVNNLLQQQVTDSEKALIRTFTPATITQQKIQSPYGTNSTIASIAAAIPLQRNTQQIPNVSFNLSDLVIQIKDEIAKNQRLSTY